MEGAAIRLVVVQGSDVGREVSVDRKLITGRAPDVDLRLDDPRVCSRHASLEPSDDGVEVTDLQSTSGTFVNEQRISTPQVIHPGDQLRFGGTVFTIVGGGIAPEPNTGGRMLPIGLAGAAVVVAASVLVVVLTKDRKPLSTAQIITRESPSMVEVLVSQTGEGLDALGSGFTLNAKRGLIITNNHVASGGSLAIRPQAKRSLRGSATIVGALPCQDLALIQVHSSAVRKVLTNSALAKRVPAPGDNVVAMGYPTAASTGETSGSEPLSATSGIVLTSDASDDSPDSGEVDLPSVVQDTAAINPGNSGGPLLNTRAQVVGIDTVTVDDTTSRRAEGESDAISSSQVLRELPLLERGAKNAWVGISFDGSITNRAGTATAALRIDGVTPGSSAAQAGIQADDVLLRINGTATPTMQAYCKAMPSTVGAQANLEIGVPDAAGDYARQLVRVTVGK